MVEEFRSIEDDHKKQYSDFSKAWDDYMADYEATAYVSLEKLKERHMEEYTAF